MTAVQCPECGRIDLNLMANGKVPRHAAFFVPGYDPRSTRSGWCKGSYASKGRPKATAAPQSQMTEDDFRCVCAFLSGWIASEDPVALLEDRETVERMIDYFFDPRNGLLER